MERSSPVGTVGMPGRGVPPAVVAGVAAGATVVAEALGSSDDDPPQADPAASSASATRTRRRRVTRTFSGSGWAAGRRRPRSGRRSRRAPPDRHPTPTCPRSWTPASTPSGTPSWDSDGTGVLGPAELAGEGGQEDGAPGRGRSHQAAGGPLPLRLRRLLPPRPSRPPGPLGDASAGSSAVGAACQSTSGADQSMSGARDGNSYSWLLTAVMIWGRRSARLRRGPLQAAGGRLLLPLEVVDDLGADAGVLPARQPGGDGEADGEQAEPGRQPDAALVGGPEHADRHRGHGEDGGGPAADRWRATVVGRGRGCGGTSDRGAPRRPPWRPTAGTSRPTTRRTPPRSPAITKARAMAPDSSSPSSGATSNAAEKATARLTASPIPRMILRRR